MQRKRRTRREKERKRDHMKPCHGLVERNTSGNSHSQTLPLLLTESTARGWSNCLRERLNSMLNLKEKEREREWEREREREREWESESEKEKCLCVQRARVRRERGWGAASVWNSPVSVGSGICCHQFLLSLSLFHFTLALASGVACGEIFQISTLMTHSPLTYVTF